MKTIRKMYDHMSWANQRILEALQSTEGKTGDVCRLFSHILFAEKVWLTRLQELDSSGLPIWGEADIALCAKLAEENKRGFAAFLNKLHPADLDKLISYTNSKGIQFTSSKRDILIHTALHSQYHRGQINAQLRANGMEPVQLDFITFVR